MVEESLAARLERADGRRTVSAFPDGSVDAFYRLSAAGTGLDTRRKFADVVTGDEDVVTLRRDAVEPGGHAVNVAAQADELGNDVTLAGHLDAPVFDEVPFETVSMGEPSSVSVYGFDDGDLLAIEPSTDVEAWSLAALDAVLGDDVADFLTADAVVCTNWTSIDGLPDALSALADRDLDGGWFVFDPGSVAGKADDDVTRLFDALAALSERYDVVLAGNLREIRALASAGDGSGEDVDAALAALRREVDLEATVVHGEPFAVVATPTGIVTAENFAVEPIRHTGGGDRFDAGMAHALVRGWGWADALRLGNACASRYVATGETGTPRELAAFLRERA